MVSLSLDKNEETVHIILQDNGVGLTQKSEHSKSFEETLIYLLADQIDGQIKCFFEGGTVYELTLKTNSKGVIFSLRIKNGKYGLQS